MIINTSMRPAPDSPGAGRRPGQRITTCRYLRRGAGGQCTAEAADPQAEILLCTHHLAEALELIAQHTGATP